jgi:hypothetical protein
MVIEKTCKEVRFADQSCHSRETLTAEDWSTIKRCIDEAEQLEALQLDIESNSDKSMSGSEDDIEPQSLNLQQEVEGSDSYYESSDCDSYPIKNVMGVSHDIAAKYFLNSSFSDKTSLANDVIEIDTTDLVNDNHGKSQVCYPRGRWKFNISSSSFHILICMRMIFIHYIPIAKS